MSINIEIKDCKEFLLTYAHVLSVVSKVEVSAIEMGLLYEFLTLPENYRYMRFSQPAKKLIMRRYKERGGKMSLVNLNAKLYSLIRKKILIRDEDGVIVIPKYIVKVFDDYVRTRKLSINLNMYEKRKDNVIS